MRFGLFGGAFALAAAVLAGAPALADGARVEVQSGVAWDNGAAAKGTIGAALGYDYTLAPRTFVGGEVSVDKTLASNRDTTVNFTGRAGVAIDPRDKLYGLAGYSLSGGPKGAIVGAGMERAIAGPIYAKAEYRHLFTDNRDDGTGYPDSHYRPGNQVLIGAGVHF